MDVKLYVTGGRVPVACNENDPSGPSTIIRKVSYMNNVNDGGVDGEDDVGLRVITTTNTNTTTTTTTTTTITAATAAAAAAAAAATVTTPTTATRIITSPESM